MEFNPDIFCRYTDKSTSCTIMDELVYTFSQEQFLKYFTVRVTQALEHKNIQHFPI